MRAPSRSVPATGVPAAISRLRDAGIDDAVLEVHVSAYRDDAGTYHPDMMCKKRRAGQGSYEQPTITGLAAAACTSCGTAALRPPPNGVVRDWRLNAVHSVYTATQGSSRARNAAAKIEAGAPGNAKTLAVLADRLRTVTAHASHAAANGAPRDVVAVIDAAVHDFERAVVTLEGLVGPDSRRAQLYTRVAGELSPPGRVPPHPVDESPLLIGIHPTRSTFTISIIDEIFRVTAIRDDDNVAVLDATRAVYDLLGRCVPTSRRRLTLVCAPRPDSTAVAQVAASLWDPAGTGPLSDLGEAITTAAHITTATS